MFIDKSCDYACNAKLVNALVKIQIKHLNANVFIQVL